MFAVFEGMAFEDVAENSLNFDENVCHQDSTCYQAVLRFQI